MAFKRLLLVLGVCCRNHPQLAMPTAPLTLTTLPTSTLTPIERDSRSSQPDFDINGDEVFDVADS